MELITVDDQTIEEFLNDQLGEKLDVFEVLQYRYKEISNKNTESEIQRYSNEVNVWLKEAIDIIENSDLFFTQFKQYIQKFVSCFEELALKNEIINKGISVVYQSKEISILEYFEETYKKYLKVMNGTVKMVEDKQDALLEKRYNTEDAFTGIKEKFSNDFKGCCFWAMHRLTSKMICEEVSFINEMKYFLTTVELVLNDIEYMKFVLVAKIFKVFKEKFGVGLEVADFIQRDFNIPVGFSKSFELENLKKFVVQQGVVFMKTSEKNQLSSVYLYYTVDKYLNIFKTEEDINPFLSISLKSCQIKFYSSEGEFYTEIYRNRICYVIRYKNQRSFNEWKRVLNN